MPTDEPKLIPTAKAAGLLSVDVRTVHRLVSAGRLTVAIKVPGKTGAYLFDPTEVERLASERKAAA